MKAELLYLGNSLSITDFIYYHEDEELGSPCNTGFSIFVVSDVFSGRGDCECDIKDFRHFISELQELYAFKRETVEWHDIYSNHLAFRLHKTGEIDIHGTLYADGKEHSLTFTFYADQSALPPFIKGLLQLI